MPKKITLYVQRYRPLFEAISQEVALLKNSLSSEYSVKIHDLHLDGIGSLQNNKEMTSFHFVWYPFLFPYTYWINAKSDLNHIYTSLGDLPYLLLLNPNKTILTAAASCSFPKVQRRIKHLQKLAAICVESEKQRQDLVSLGVNPQKISLIFPPVDENKFRYIPARGTFTILCASCPTRSADFSKRGINFLLDYLKSSPSPNIASFTLLWRGGAYADVQRLIQHQEISPPFVKLKNEIIKDMNKEYAQIHATIIPYTEYDDLLKLIPNSAVESLAAGKPVLASSKTEIAKIIRRHQCGVVFEPTVEGLHRAIQDLQQDYSHYQKNCRPVASQYFSKEQFVQQYQQIYRKILSLTP